MFFDLYDTQGEEVAAIIKDAATDVKNTSDDKSDNSATITHKLKALNRKRTITVIQENTQAEKAPTPDDNYERL